MTFESALRASELLLGFAFLQQSLEFLATPLVPRPLMALRAALAVALAAGFAPGWTGLALLAVALALLHRFDGPYNGGSDRMGLLVLTCLTAARLAPDPRWQELAFAYLAGQLVLSYVISGWVKIANPDWRRGAALPDVFRFSTYPVSEDLRRWADRPRALMIASWAVMVLELAFPLFLLSRPLLVTGLVLAAGFHLANAVLFGLNRFFWTWIAAYPSLLWLQDRLS